METKKILEEIINQMIKVPNGMFQFRCLKFDLIYYVYIEELWIVKNQFSTTLGGEKGNSPCKYKLAVLRNKEIIESKSDIELAEILQELKEHHVKEHVL